MYQAGTNGRPVKQSYTLTGSATIGPPKGKNQRKGTEPASRTPPPRTRPTSHPPQPGKTRTRHQGNSAPGDAAQRKRGEGTQRGRQGNTTPPTDPSQEWRGTTPRPHSQGGRGATTHKPHTHTEPPTQAQRGEDRHQNAPPTRRRHNRAHTTHTTTAATNTSPTNTHNTQKRERCPHHKHTQHRKIQRTQRPPPRRGAGPPEPPLGRKGRPTSSAAHHALSQEWRDPHPATPNDQRGPSPHPEPKTATPTPAAPPTTNQSERHLQHPSQQKHPGPTATPAATAPSTAPATPSPTPTSSATPPPSATPATQQVLTK